MMDSFNFNSNNKLIYGKKKSGKIGLWWRWGKCIKGNKKKYV